MKKIKNIEIIYNVPYSPESNPIEKVFNEIKKYLKDNCITNKNIVKMIKKSINNIKKGNLLKYFIKSINFY